MKRRWLLALLAPSLMALAPNQSAEAARAAANAAMAYKQAEQAAKLFDRALALAPLSPLLWTDIARFRLTTGDAGGAIAAADRALSLAVGAGPATQQRALLLKAQLTRGQYGLRAALPLFERALALHPGNVETMTEFAATLAEAGQARTALAMTRETLAIDRANPRAYFIQAVIAARAGRMALARALLDRTRGQIDAAPATMLLRGALEIDAGNSEQAIAQLNDLLRARPLHFPARRLLALAHWQAGDSTATVIALLPLARRADADPWTLTLMGRALEAQGKAPEAKPFLKRAVEARPGPAASFDLADWPGADPASADVAIPRISQLIAGGRAAEAVALARTVRVRNPGSPGAWVVEGDALIAANAPGAAADAYAQAANIDFSESIALRLIAALNRAGNGREAARVAGLSLAQNPRSIAMLTLAANAALATRRWQRASALFGHLLQRLGPGDRGAAAGLAAARQRLGTGAGG